nr:ribonuclease H-like domain-containing protein [Tanacetum cinerariifolium]
MGRRITRGTIRIFQSKVPSLGADEIAFLTGDVRFRKAFPTDTSLDAGQDRENIAKTYALPHEAPPRFTSLGGGEGRSRHLRIIRREEKDLLKRMLQTRGRGVDQRDDLLDRDKSADKRSDSTDEMSYVLGSLGAANILASGGLRSVFTTASISVATASTYISPAVATASGSFSTTAIFITASVATPTSRVTRSSRGVVIGSSSPISINISSISKKDKGKGEQAKRDSEIARIHAEKELKMMITELDRSNEMVVKYLTKDFKGMTFEQIEEKFIPAWEKMQDFMPMNSKIESERIKRPGIQLDKEKSKKLKTVEASGTEPTQEQQSEEPKELSEEELKKMMELVLVEELYIEALQVKYPIIDWEIYSEGQRKCMIILTARVYPTVRLSVPTADVIAKKLATVEDFALLTPWPIKGVLRNFIPPKLDLVYPSLDDFVDKYVSESVVEKPTIKSNEPKTVRKENRAPIIEDWVSESESETARRPINNKTTSKNSKINQKVNIVRAKQVNTARTKVNTARPKAVLNAVQRSHVNAVKASTCWVWRPKHKVLDHVSRNNGASMSFKIFDYIDAQGISKHMTRNRSYLTDYEEIDGGFVSFGGNSKGGKITGKGKIRTDFKLSDESHVLLKVPRKDNMYNVDLKMLFLKEIFDIDALTKSMNYKSVVVGNQTNGSAGTTACDGVGKARVETVPDKDYILLPLWTQDPLFSSSSKDSLGAGFKPLGDKEKKDVVDPGNEDSEVPSTEEPRVNQENDANVNNTNNINTVSPTDNVAGIEDNAVDENIVYGCADDPNMPDLEEISRSKLPNGKRAIGTKWVFRNKKDERGIVIKNKARLVAQGYTQEEKIDYDEVFAPVTRCEAIRLFLAYSLFKDFVVYQMDVKSAFLYVKIEEEVYRASTSMVTQKPLLKDEDGAKVNVHMYRSMIGSLMYLTSLMPNIMFAQTVVANSTTEAEYIAASNCCGQAYTYYCQLKVNDARHKLTTA